jgi:hypothetical protein
MIRCEVCNEAFSSQEEYDAHWKYILDTPIRQYNEMVKSIDMKMSEFINKRKKIKLD